MIRNKPKFGVKKKKTLTRRKHRCNVYAKTTIKRGLQGGGLFGTSHDDKIIKRLRDLMVISKSQGNKILDFTKTGKNKKEKITLLVDKSLVFLLTNLNNIWKKTPDDIRKKPELKELVIILNKQIPEQKDGLYVLLHSIHKEYEKLAKPTKDELNAALGKIQLDDNISGETILPVLYNLQEKWVKTDTLKTLVEPKFADLYEKWFDIAHKGWADRHKWLLLFS